MTPRVQAGAMGSLCGRSTLQGGDG